MHKGESSVICQNDTSKFPHAYGSYSSITKSKLVPLTVARQVTTAVSPNNVTRPGPAKNIFTKPHSSPRRNINYSLSPKASTFPLKVTGAKAPMGNPQHALKDKGVIDSGCSRHMIGNMSYLFEFEEINGGYVAFGGNPKGGKISGKGKIRTGKLDFDDVYFVKELKFNLFCVSHMCNKKNSVLFTDIKCIVLSPEFKLPDENQVMLRDPRENNMYNVDLKNIAPFGDLTCNFDGKADEGFLVGYSVSSKAFRVFNSITRIVQVTLHLNFLENKPNVAEKAREEDVQQYVLFPLWSSGSTKPQNTDDDAAFGGKKPEFEGEKPKSEVHVSPSSSTQTKKHDDKTKREDKDKSPVELSIGYRNLSVEFEDFSNHNINEVNVADNPVPVVGQFSTNSTNTFSVAGPFNTVVSSTHGKSSYMDTSQYPDGRRGQQSTKESKEDLEVLWKLVKERFASSKPKNFSDDFLLTILTYMFEKLDVQAQVWKNQRTVHGLAKCMRTRSSLNLPGKSSPSPTSSNPKRRNQRHSKKPFILKESLVDMMVGQRTMAELLRAPTEGYAEAIMVPPILAEQFKLKHTLINMMTPDQFFRLKKDNPHDHIRWFNKITSTIKYKDVPNSSIKLMLFPFSLVGAACRWLEKEPARSILTWKDLDRYKDLLHVYPHHGFTELHQLDIFYNALNPADQYSLNSAAGGNLFERRGQDVLTTIENKSKVRNSQNRSIVSQVKSSDANSSSSSEIAKLTHSINQQTSAVTTTMAAILKQFQATPPTASVKSVEEICVTCGDAQQYYQSAVNYNQSNSGYCPLGPLPTNTIANLKGELKVIITRSGIVLNGTSVPMHPSFINPDEDKRVEET
nr:ribonuclease H-like domain-containing protein [Tanacetum cinerariifolium]